MNTEIKELLSKNYVITTIVSIMIATRIDELVNSFTNCICLPIFNIDLNKDGKPDIDQIKKLEVNLYFLKIKPGLFIIELLKFLLTFIIIYYTMNFILK